MKCKHTTKQNYNTAKDELKNEKNRELKNKKQKKQKTSNKVVMST